MVRVSELVFFSFILIIFFVMIQAFHFQNYSDTAFWCREHGYDGAWSVGGCEECFENLAGEKICRRVEIPLSRPWSGGD